MEVVNRWLVAQSRLKQSASDFLDACIALKALSLQPLASRHHQETLESALDTILPHIGSIPLVENKLRESCAMLNALRNRSATRTPINRLPPELLSHIFSIAADPFNCRRDHFSRSIPLMNIPRVCVLWHQVCANTPRFWSHIDVDLNILSIAPNMTPTFDRTRMWLDRSRGAPIHLHFVGISKVPQHVVSGLVSILQPRLTDLGSLIISGIHNYGLFQALFDLCSNLGNPSPLKTLSLANIHIRHEEHAISWPIPSLSALVEIDLRELNQYALPPFEEIVAMLSNCPTLHTLRLRSLGIYVDSQQTYPMIHLPYLKLLELSICNDREGITQLLPILSPGVHELDIKLNLPYYGAGGWGSHLQALMARSNVTYLTFQNTFHADFIKSLLSSTPRLRVLVLQFIGSGNTIEELLLSPEGDYAPLLPCLQCLCLVSCCVTLEVVNKVERVVAERSLRSLVFWSCYFFNPEANDTDEDQGYMAWPQQPPQSVRERLSEQVDRLVIRSCPPERVQHGVDLSIQELINSD